MKPETYIYREERVGTPLIGLTSPHYMPELFCLRICCRKPWSII